MKYLILKDRKKRLLFNHFELENLRFKSVVYNRSLNSKIRHLVSLKLTLFSKNFSKVRVRNRCVLTGRSRSVYRFFKLSRISFKKNYVGAKKLLGFKKSSW